LLTSVLKQSEQKVSKNYKHEIGYETLQSDFDGYKKQVPKGVTLAKGGNNIYLQFKTPNKSRSKYPCNCSFSIDGMIDAVRKARKVKDKLETLTSEVDFWNWYDTEIKNESQLVDDRLTFGEAIKKVEDDFWNRPDRRKQKRDKSNPSHQSSWDDTYGRFYKFLPVDKPLNFEGIEVITKKWEEGSKTYKGVVSAMKKLSTLNKRRDILDKLTELKATQTKYSELQTIDIEEFMRWRDKTLGLTSPLSSRCKLDVRKAWLWVFSAQIIYALRIGEVFAIKNLTEPYITKDGEPIPALNDPNNTMNLIYIGEKTAIDTTVKTGARLARPQVPPKYPDLLKRLDIKNPLLPTNKPQSRKPKTLINFYNKSARAKLIKWNAPFTQTHADRNLGNINGMQAGIPQEIRAMSMGHTPAMNDSGYKKRIGTKTKIDLLLNSNTSAIDFVTALGEAKKLVKENKNNKRIIAQLLSVIYQKNEKEIFELL